MQEITSIKEIIDPDSFAKKTEDDPRRIYGILLCADEHHEFIRYIRDAWQTLNELSGEACNIFTLERRQTAPSDKKYESNSYVRLSDNCGIQPGNDYGYAYNVAVDNGLAMPRRAECFRVREYLFESPRDILFPGIAIFPSVSGKQAKYYACGGLKPQQLSELMQVLLTTIAFEYRSGCSNTELFNRFECSEQMRMLRQYTKNALLKISIGDLIKVVSTGLRFVMPKD